MGMKPIAQLRFNLFMLSLEEYDCSLGGNWTIDWSTRGTARPKFGGFCILFGLVTIPPYLLCAHVIWTMRRNATYKVMFVLAIADIFTLSVNSLTFGIFLIMGEVFCHHPKIHAVNAATAMFFFTLSCISCVVLAINRMLELVSSRLYHFIFHGLRTWYLLVATIAYSSFIAFFTPLFLFNSDYHLLVVNPGIYEDRYDYYSIGHVLNNTLMPSISLSAYVFMLFYLLFKRGAIGQDKSNAVNRAAMMLSVQSGIIVVVHFTTCITYMITQFVRPSDAVLYMAQVAWQLLHGIPPFIYMLFNPSLRNGVLQYAAPVRSAFIGLPSSAVQRLATVVPNRNTEISQIHSHL